MGMDSICSQFYHDRQCAMAHKVQSIACNSASLNMHVHRILRDVQQQGLGRYSTIIKAVIEAAVVSWIATLGSAVVWSDNSACSTDNYELSNYGLMGHNCMMVCDPVL
jgi:hypothetical protein